jgi:hypothetical protein
VARPLVALGALLAVSCEGAIDGPPAGPGGAPEAGTAAVTFHRLNRYEYDNTVRDLLGTTRRPAEDFPDDDVSYGFDNIAEVLSTSPLHVELYQRAAETLVAEALAPGAAEEVRQLEAEEVGSTVGAPSGEAWNLYSSGSIDAVVELPAAGDYRITVRAWQDAAGPEAARMTLAVDGVALGSFDVVAESAPGQDESVETALAAGPRQISVSFENDYWMDPEDRNLHVDWIRIEGPLGAAGSNPARDRILVCAEQTPDCARLIFETFGRRAWRRPLTAEELDGLAAFLDLAAAEGEGFDRGIELGLTALLVSPSFLFRVELDGPDGEPVSGWELASRLSYFLWSSMPDDRLLDKAASGTLSDDPVLRAEVERMLLDERSRSLVESFAGQWLLTRDIGDVEPDYRVFPVWDPSLGQTMRRETELFFEEVLRADHPLPELLAADWSFVDDRLATHYGLPPVGPGFVRTELPPERQAGLLGRASVHVVTSYPRRTSPVRRGKFVLERLLCDAPDDPPPGVEGLEEQMIETGTLRERMELHRTNPVCAQCHVAMDAIGLGMESFDAIGSHRLTDGGSPIDATGELPSGERFDGPVELAALLAEDPRFARCVAEKLLTYGAGRGLSTADRAWLDVITEHARGEGNHLRAMITAVVLSEPFRTRPGGRR